MYILRRIKFAEREKDGSVTVYYSNGRNDTFEGPIDADAFAEWEDRGFDYRRPPTGVQTRPPIVKRGPEE
jgi:hypothetical protein